MENKKRKVCLENRSRLESFVASFHCSKCLSFDNLAGGATLEREHRRVLNIQVSYAVSLRSRMLHDTGFANRYSALFTSHLRCSTVVPWALLNQIASSKIVFPFKMYSASRKRFQHFCVRVSVDDQQIVK